MGLYLLLINYIFRLQQLEELEEANRRYSIVNDDFTRLMTGVERRFENLPSVGRDQRGVQQQLTQVQPLRSDVTQLKPKIEEMNKVSQTLENLQREVEKPVQSRPVQRSTDIGSRQGLSIDEPVAKKVKRTYEQLEHSAFGPEGERSILFLF